MVKSASGIKDLPGKGDVPALDGEGLLGTSNGQLHQRHWVIPSDITAETNTHGRSLRTTSSEKQDSSDYFDGNGESRIVRLACSLGFVHQSTDIRNAKLPHSMSYAPLRLESLACTLSM